MAKRLAWVDGLLEKNQNDLDEILEDIRYLQTEPPRMRGSIGYALASTRSYTGNARRFAIARAFTLGYCERLRARHAMVRVCKASHSVLQSITNQYNAKERFQDQLRYALGLQARMWTHMLAPVESLHLEKIWRIRMLLGSYLESTASKLPREFFSLAKEVMSAYSTNKYYRHLVEELVYLWQVGSLCSMWDKETRMAGVSSPPSPQRFTQQPLDRQVGQPKLLGSGTHRRIAIMMQRFHEGPPWPSNNRRDPHSLAQAEESRARLKTLWDAIREEIRTAAHEDKKILEDSVSELIDFDVPSTFSLDLEQKQHVSTKEATTKPSRHLSIANDEHLYFNQFRVEEQVTPTRRKCTKAKAARLNSLTSTTSEPIGDDNDATTERQDPIEDDSACEDSTLIPVPQGSLDIFHKMFSNEGTTCGNVRWTQFLQALLDAGLTWPRRGRTAGVSLAFSNGNCSCTLHKPHNGIVEPHVLRNMGKQLGKALGWNRERFELKRKESLS